MECKATSPNTSVRPLSADERDLVLVACSSSNLSVYEITLIDGDRPAEKVRLTAPRMVEAIEKAMAMCRAEKASEVFIRCQFIQEVPDAAADRLALMA